MRYELTAGAEEDYLKALVHFETRRTELRADFERDLEALIERICESPRMYPLVHPPDIRQARMGRPFRYSVIYRESDAGIRIIAVHHPSRKPGYWMDRI